MKNKINIVDQTLFPVSVNWDINFIFKFYKSLHPNINICQNPNGSIVRTVWNK